MYKTVEQKELLHIVITQKTMFFYGLVTAIS